MALYTVSSSGNLKIADTGLKNPVSFFTPEGIATGAIADGPLAGNNKRVYIIDGRSNRFQSSGQLKLLPGDIISGGNAISAAALGEIPLAGGDNFYLGTGIIKAFITSANQSSGNLKITGSVVAYVAYRKISSGNLKLTGNVVTRSLRRESTNGQLKLSSNVATRSIIKITSTGNLLLLPVDSYNIHLVESTTNQLKLTGYSGVGLKQDSSGQLVITGSFTRNIFLKPTSSGQLTVATQWYSVNRIGGLSTEALGSAPITAGTDNVQDILNTTGIAFYGRTGLSSTGNLKVTPYGTPPSDLTQDGSLAGSALAASSITEHRFNYNSTQFRQLLNIDSSGQLRFDLSVKYRVDSEGAQLVVTGQAGYNNDRRTSGQLRLTSSQTHSSTQVRLSSGQIRVRPVGENPLGLDSGLGGTALASLPLSGGIDLIVGQSKFSSTRRELTLGQLRLSGVAGVGVKRLSSGQLVLTSSIATSSLRREITTGQLRLTSNLATRSIRRVISSGSLTLYHGEAFRDIWTERSTGQLKLTGSSLPSSSRRELTSGQLRLTSSILTRSIRVELTSGQLRVRSIGENPLALDSGLGSSALASIPLAGSVDLIIGQAKFNSTRVEITGGQLKLSSTVSTNSIRLEATAGNLTLTGSTVWRRRPVFNTAGNLITNGAFTHNVRHGEQTTGQLQFNNSGLLDAVDQSSALAGGPLAASPIAGGKEQVLFQTKITYVIKGVVYNDTGFSGGSAGNLKLTGSTVSRSLRKESTTGQLVVTGAHVNNTKHAETTTGQLVVTGTHSKKVIHDTISSGRLSITGTHAKHIVHVGISSGQLVSSGVATFDVIANGRITISVISTGNLQIAGSATATTNIVPKTETRKTNSGGSYVYSTSWDILRPYFPDDRHILGYRELLTSGTGTVELFGTSTVDFISAPKVSRENTLLKYIQSVEEDRKKSSIKVANVSKSPKPIVIPEVFKFKQQALQEDELLLTGSLLDFEDPDDELDRELLLY